MSFGTGLINDPQQQGSGERYGTNQVILSYPTFEDGLIVGRFAKFDSGSIDNFDSSATPVIAGVVLRDGANPVEDDNTLTAENARVPIEVIRQGLVTVDVKAGETPERFGRVFISNDGDASDGMATADNSDVDANAEFIMEIQTGVWLIYVTPAPGDVSTHISDAVGAHAASAISLLDSAGLTAQTEVEAAIAEILVRTPVAIADPGDGNAIPVARSGNVAITTAAAETRTMAIPPAVGITIAISCDVHAVGDAVITVASAFNQNGDTTITLNGAGDTVVLTAVQIGGVLAWRLVVNDGAVLG